MTIILSQVNDKTRLMTNTTNFVKHNLFSIKIRGECRFGTIRLNDRGIYCRTELRLQSMFLAGYWTSNRSSWINNLFVISFVVSKLCVSNDSVPLETDPNGRLLYKTVCNEILFALNTRHIRSRRVPQREAQLIEETWRVMEMSAALRRVMTTRIMMVSSGNPCTSLCLHRTCTNRRTTRQRWLARVTDILFFQYCLLRYVTTRTNYEVFDLAVTVYAGSISYHRVLDLTLIANDDIV